MVESRMMVWCLIAMCQLGTAIRSEADDGLESWNSVSSNATLDALRARISTDAFDMCDTDGSGKVNSEELKVGVKELGMEMEDQDIQKMVSHFDDDGNGAIGRDNFLKMIKATIRDYSSSLLEADATADKGTLKTTQLHKRLDQGHANLATLEDAVQRKKVTDEMCNEWIKGSMKSRDYEVGATKRQDECFCKNGIAGGPQCTREAVEYRNRVEWGGTVYRTNGWASTIKHLKKLDELGCRCLTDEICHAAVPGAVASRGKCSCNGRRFGSLGGASETCEAAVAAAGNAQNVKFDPSLMSGKGCLCMSGRKVVLLPYK